MNKEKMGRGISSWKRRRKGGKELNNIVRERGSGRISYSGNGKGTFLCRRLFMYTIHAYHLPDSY